MQLIRHHIWLESYHEPYHSSGEIIGTEVAKVRTSVLDEIGIFHYFRQMSVSENPFHTLQTDRHRPSWILGILVADES